MKTLLQLVLLVILTSCNTATLVDSWKSPEIETYAPDKVLVVGMTSNIEARQKFEQQLTEQYTIRGIEAAKSLDYFDAALRTERMTEEELKTIEDQLISEGFDTVLFTKIIGVEDKIKYKEDYEGFDNTHRRFKEDYLKYQDIYYNSDYYEEYTVYHAETAMYCICPTKDRELIWKGYVDIVEPESIDGPVGDYVKLIISVLEEQQLIKPLETTIKNEDI